MKGKTRMKLKNKGGKQRGEGKYKMEREEDRKSRKCGEKQIETF